MKSMMSQVKNCSTLFLCTLLLFAAGCKKEDQNAPEQQQPQEQTQPTDPVTPPVETIAGNVAQPDWQLPADYDMTSSLTAIVKVDLALSFKAEQLAGWQLAEGDVLAAFDGDNCLGLASPKDGLFMLYVTAPKEGNPVSLKYYSVAVKNLFIASETIVYKNDEVMGSVAQPYTPNWTVAK